MSWLNRNLPEKHTEQADKPHRHDWSGWQDSSLEWQEERACACGAREWRNKR